MTGINVFSFQVLIKTRAVKRLKYLIVINRINVIVNSRLIANLFSILNIPWFLCPINCSHFNALINMEKCIGLPCANVFLLITLAYTDQNRKIQKKACSAIKRWTYKHTALNIAVRVLILCFEAKKIKKIIIKYEFAFIAQ